MSRKIARLVLPVSAALLPALVLCTVPPSSTPDEADPASSRSIAPSTSGYEYQGASSCSAVGCHGGSESRAGGASAYRIWITRDPHAEAYAVLADERSERIAVNLAGPTRSVIRPTDDARCLNCHVHADAKTTRHATTFTLFDGVSCESCHGPAERWVQEHWSDWKTHPVKEQQKQQSGMNTTQILVAQARLCAGCHVGGSGRDVNHDLIAAGHPRLNFEFSAFLANMPAHWDVGQGNDPARESQAWAIGQVASACAALELLAWRAASDSKALRPWPEFGEYSCASCHHDLSSMGWARTGNGSGDAGRLRWGTWSMPLASRLVDGVVREPASSVLLLRAEMARPEPRPSEVERLAHRAAAACRAGLDRLDSSPPLSPDALRELIESAARQPPSSWEEATQLYLAAAAHQHALKGRNARPSPDGDASLRAMFDSLAFPDGSDTHGGSGGATPDDFLAALARYLSSVNTKPDR
ncbi:MAG: multiheme c-type cytochrome [Isosphaeraceae bacterium]|nr:multiheme c-type cytochrome [Isosphaeraceae bacterium]